MSEERLPHRVTWFSAKRRFLTQTRFSDLNELVEDTSGEDQKSRTTGDGRWSVQLKETTAAKGKEPDPGGASSSGSVLALTKNTTSIGRNYRGTARVGVFN